MLSSLASAPGANAHVAEAQLPAYWRNEGRNDTRSGRRLPRMGKNSSPARIAPSTSGDEKLVTAKPFHAGCPQNRNTAAKENSTFHCSGTAMGDVEMMNRWKITMPMTASSVTVGLGDNSTTRGRTSSTVV